MKSFIKYNEKCHFPIQNLPYGIFSSDDNSIPRGSVAIGDLVLDLAKIESNGLLSSNYFRNSNLKKSDSNFKSCIWRWDLQAIFH